MTPPLELDVLRETRPSRWPLWLLLLVGVVFCADSIRYYLALRSEVTQKTAQVAQHRQRGTPAVRLAEHIDDEEYKAAQQTIDRLSLPWDKLFRALEAARTDEVVLNEIDPDPANGTVSISGEAASYLALLSYVARLADQRELHGVRLAKHEDRGAAKGWSFRVNASWQDPR